MQYFPAFLLGWAGRVAVTSGPETVFENGQLNPGADSRFVQTCGKLLKKGNLYWPSTCNY
jgi:hypothetical protein